MASFPENLALMVAKPRSVRKVARAAGVDEKTIRNWLNRQDPSKNIKAKDFLDAVDLPWPRALGDFDLTTEWWAGFLAKLDGTPQERAVAYIKRGEWSKMTPDQRAAIMAVVAAFEIPTPATAAPPPVKPKQPRKAG